MLIVEEGFPDYVEQAVNAELRRADIQTRIHGKGALPKAGEYTGEVMLRGLANFLAAAKPAGIDTAAIVREGRHACSATRRRRSQSVGDLPPRPPNFCTGCPERPVFAALKLTQREIGPTHISADIGCHSFATFAPFRMGNSILGYGMSLASAAAVAPNLEARPISVMGDGGFWHNGLITGVASNLFNKNDGVLIVMQNGYTSATGQQYMPSSATSRQGAAPGMDIESDAALVRRQMAAQGAHLQRRHDGEDPEGGDAHRRVAGLKVIIADGECQLARQRRVRAEDAVKLKAGERVVRTKFGVDDEICTGDHSCIRLSGCPSLTVKPSPDPLRTDPVATVIEMLRRLRAVRRGRACGGALPVVLPRRGDPERERVGPLHASHAPHRDRLARAARGGGVSDARPFTLLIAALGGEGGGVLTDWIVSAAEASGLPVQSTSIPGVAQRTGATTYYVEIFPVPHARARRQAPGARARARRRRRRHGGGERIARGRPRDRERLRHRRPHAADLVDQPRLSDGREDADGRRTLRLASACSRRSSRMPKQHLLFDMEAAAKQAGAIVNAVMLGAIAGSGRLPIPVEAFEAAIKADGKAVESNLRGFRAGLAAARDQLPVALPRSGKRAAKPTLAALEAEAAALPEAGTRDRHRRRAPPRRLPGCRLRAALSRSPQAGRREPTASCSPRPRGISRCACRSRT